MKTKDKPKKEKKKDKKIIVPKIQAYELIENLLFE